MTKVLLQAVKMSDAKVSHVSLVERGANRAPFKIIKEDSTMKNFASLDLGRLLTRKADPTPSVQIVGVVTLKDEHLPSITDAVKAAGFDVATPQEVVEKDDSGADAATSVIFTQDGATLEGQSVILKMSDDVALVCKGFSPYCMDMKVGDMSFADQVAAQGFYPSVSTVMDVARSAIYDTVSKSDDPASAASAVAKMLVEVSKYAETMVANLPSKCFKLEGVVKADPVDDPQDDDTNGDAAAAAAVTKGSQEGAAHESGEASTLESGETGSEDKTKTKKDEAPVQSTAPEALTSEQVSKMVSDKVGEASTALVAKMGEMLTAFGDNIAKSVKEVDARLAEVAGKVAKTDEKATALAATLRGVTVGGDTNGDHAHQPAKKSESTGREIDTAFNSRARTVVHGRSASR